MKCFSKLSGLAGVVARTLASTSLVLVALGLTEIGTEFLRADEYEQGTLCTQVPALTCKQDKNTKTCNNENTKCNTGDTACLCKSKRSGCECQK